MNKKDKLEREEKQPEGIKFSPLLFISMEWNEKEMKGRETSKDGRGKG